MMTFVRLSTDNAMQSPDTVLLTSQGIEREGEDISDYVFETHRCLTSWTPFQNMENRSFSEVYEAGTRMITSLFGFEPSAQYEAPDLVSVWYFTYNGLVCELTLSDTGNIDLGCEHVTSDFSRFDDLYRTIWNKLQTLQEI